MPEFLFPNKKVPFTLIDTTKGKNIYVGQPAKIPGRYVPNVEVMVTPEIFKASTQWYRARPANKEDEEFYPAIVLQQLAIGIPRGTYVPILWNRYSSRFEITTETLENEALILCDSLANEEVKKKVYGVKPEEDDDDDDDDEVVVKNANVPAAAKF